VISFQNHIQCEACFIYQQHFAGERLEMLHPTVVAIRRTLFNAHYAVAVAGLEHGVHGTGTAADHASPSPLFTGKCGDSEAASWY
jgi:hypothetical protein